MNVFVFAFRSTGKLGDRQHRVVGQPEEMLHVFEHNLRGAIVTVQRKFSHEHTSLRNRNAIAATWIASSRIFAGSRFFGLFFTSSQSSSTSSSKIA